MNSSREIVIEIFEEHSKVNFYSLRYVSEELSETDIFFENVLDQENLKEDVEIISKMIDKIGEHGAEPRHFRNAGSKFDKVGALPEYLKSSKLRLYAIRLNNEIVILGNGGVKNTKTYNEDPFLNECVELLRKIDYFLEIKLSNRKVFIFRKQLMGDLKFYIKDEKK